MQKRPGGRDDAADGDVGADVGVGRDHHVENAGVRGGDLHLLVQVLAGLGPQLLRQEQADRHVHAVFERVVALPAGFTLVFKTHTALYRAAAGCR
jgi:hypothetical protein